MALETGSFISDLNSSNPQSSDSVSQADDHIRLIKATVKATFPNVTGAVTKTHTQLNNTLDKTGDTMTGALTLSGAPSSNLHAATKAYVDTADATKAATATTITAGTGLTGGGDLSANRTISVASGGIGTTQLADSGVTTAKIADSNVTTAKIAANAVTAAKLASDAATTGSLGSSGWTRLPNGLTLAWGELTVSYSSTSNNNFYSCSGSATLPVTFSSVYQAQVSYKDADGVFYAAAIHVSSITTTTINVAGNFRQASSTEPNTVSYFVIGTS